MQKRRDIRKMNATDIEGGNFWEEALAYTLEADAPMTEADIAAIFDEWTFPIVEHKVDIAPDGLSAKVIIVCDNCD